MKERVAIIGTGIAGLGCAWHLRERCDLTLFEQCGRAGGHTNTVSVDEDGVPIPIDTGFIVFNKVTYPNLCRLFEELRVPTKPAEMSFGVQHLASGLEYNGMGFRKLFAQPRNLFNPRFHRFIVDVFRFFRMANALIRDGREDDVTLRDFVEMHRLGPDFLNWYLTPMSSAVWSTDPQSVLEFPAATLIRFFHNHGFLGTGTHHPWFTVDGGAKCYVDKILAQSGSPWLREKIASLEENASTITITAENGQRWKFDRVILATHADQALNILTRPSDTQARLLSPFRYQRNHALLHVDESVMPRARRAWASWNYRVEPSGRAATHYWMNALQNVSHKKNYFVSLNSEHSIPRDKILYETTYEHPVFTRETSKAQQALPTLNAYSPDQRVFFCGSYFKYGFHEDAYVSALDTANCLQRILNG